MYKFLIYVLSIVTLLNATVEPVNDPYKEIEYFVLDNGLQVYLLSNEKATNTNISMTINVGWDIESDEKYGLSHLVEHMVFRDKRVPHRDYLDYLKDEGASDVNGYTSRYETELITKIDSNKSYWVAKTFAQMIFDKDVDKEDIEVEKGTVQVEIGELHWYDKIVSTLGKVRHIFPPRPSIYETHFGLKKPKELPSFYLEKVNNKDFTLDEVMAHYEKYYYPSNMILKITGNFEIEKMKSLIIDSYGKVDKNGTLRANKPPRDATLSHKPYVQYREGANTNHGYIGAQYLFDDCQKHIILNAFIKFVATKIQQELRNKNGKTYSVSTYNRQSRGAGIVSVSFDGLHDDFEDNMALVQKRIKYYVENIDDTMIDEALEEYQKRYTSVEFDSDSLSDLVNNAEHMRSDHHIIDKTHYEFFAAITPERFTSVLLETFIPENKYKVIYRDYYLFPGDIALIGIFIWFLMFFIYFRFSHLLFSFRGVAYQKREVILSHRIANRFIGFVYFLVLIFLSMLVYGWIKYFILKYIIGNVNYFYTLESSYSLYEGILSALITVALMFSIFRWVMHYYSRVDVTEENMYILGSNPYVIKRDEVEDIEVVPWQIDKLFRTLGFAFFFWRPLLKVVTKQKTYYIRSSDAHGLKEDLMNRWLQQ